MRLMNRRGHAEELVQQVKTRKLYLDPELTLSTLSKAIGISEREITFILNRELHQNFYYFINSFRIEEVKAKLADPGNKHLKIISLAYESGFNSKATFNRLFKSHVGMSPSAYIKTSEYQRLVMSETFI